MRIETPAWTRTGTAIDGRDRPIPPTAFARAVANSPAASNGRIRVVCPPIGELHVHVGLLARATADAFSRRRALAAAARSRGIVPDVADDLAAARAELAACSVPTVDVTRARERVANAREAVESTQASVAAARGAVEARESLAAQGSLAGVDADAVNAGDARDRLEDAIATASERETELLAAEQALERARERAREARNVRERRLELEDRVGNLERRARTQLVEAVDSAFVGARARVRDAVTGGASADGASPSPPVLDALAVVCVAELAAPVVLAAGCFACADRARNCLDAPVILARPSDP